MGAVVAYGPVAAVGAGERVLVEVGVGEPGEVLADLGGVGPARLLRQRRGSQRRDVAIEDCGVGRRQGDRCPAPSPRRRRRRVL